MDGWKMTSFKITKTVAEKKLGDDFVSLAGDELVTSFDSYQLDLTKETIYFKAPKQYSYNQIASYGGKLNYLLRYSGYEMGKKKKYFLHDTCYFNLTVDFQNWSLQLTLEIAWPLAKIKVAIVK